MNETVPSTMIGNNVLTVLVQAATWLAFGFFLAGGWHLEAWLTSKL